MSGWNTILVHISNMNCLRLITKLHVLLKGNKQICLRYYNICTIYFYMCAWIVIICSCCDYFQSRSDSSLIMTPFTVAFICVSYLLVTSSFTEGNEGKIKDQQMVTKVISSKYNIPDIHHIINYIKRLEKYNNRGYNMKAQINW